MKSMLFVVFTLILNCGLGLSPTLARDLPEFTKLVEVYGPAVVNISTTAKKEKESQSKDSKKDKQIYRGIPGLPEDSPFNDFFRHFFDDGEGSGGDDGEEGEMIEERPATSLGSGFILSADGYIISNNHVIDDAGEIVVRLNDRREFSAKLIGADKRSDLALLKVEATNLPFVKLGSSGGLRVGEWVLAIGSPFGFDHSATAGIVSALGRNLPSDNYVPFIQTDVAINPGNSGGPLFNMDGEVIGVNSQIYSRTGGFMGLSFAIPVDVMKNVVEQLKTSGKVSRGWLGVLIQDVTRELAESFGMDKPHGALVSKVLSDSPAEAAEFQVGDIITHFNGKEVDHSADLPPIVGITPINTVVEVQVIRRGKPVTLKVTIAELPAEEDIKLATTKGGSKSATSTVLGLSVIDLDDKERSNLDVSEGGVLVQRVGDGAAKDAGIRKGDVVLQINNTEVKNVIHFKELAAALEPGQTIPVLVHRHGQPLFLALKIPQK
ncbi:MAG: serine peptidase [Beggiatoa sp. IS2]|nr:MAG: serine peptidase [Beggiatoa sp. IS2]